MRRKILDAARELFASEGYEKVTMRRIAEAIEYSPTTIYGHFEDKDDVVKCLCEEDFARLRGALDQGPAPSDPLEGLRQLGLAYAQFGLSHPNHYRFMFMTVGKFIHQQEPADPGQQSFGLVREAVSRAIDAGALPRMDVHTAAQVLWASVHGAVALLITLPADKWPQHPPVADLVTQVVDNAVRGLRARS